MNKTVTVPLPLNTKDEELYLYRSYNSYELIQPKIKRIKNVFVANTGFCLNKKGLIQECHHDYPHQHDEFLNEVSHYFYDAQDHPENLITLDDTNVYLVIHHPYFNYYHWICESVFRLWMVRHQLNNLTLILPERYKNADFIMGSLEPFKLKNIYILPNGKSLLVRTLCLPQLKPVCDSYNSKHVRQVREFYTNYVFKEKKIAVKKITRLYVSRKLAGRRQVINEHEFIPILRKYGFTIFSPEKFSFVEQIAIFSGVEYLVGMHGSGLTNMLFMRKGTSLLELHKNETNDLNHPSPLFWFLAEALDINYYHQSCETVGRKDYFEGEYSVDIVLLEQNLKIILSK